MKDNNTPTLPPAEPADAMVRPQRGDELELQIDSLAFGGEGVARLGDGGYVVFVAGAIPGDRVRAVVHKRKRSYAHARTLEVLEPSPERIAPLADHPGVPWQVLPYERQLEIKRAQVDEALRRIGRLDGFELEEIIPAVEPWRYRNKLEYSFGEGGDPAGPELVCGFHAPAGGNRVASIDDCLLASERGNLARSHRTHPGCGGRELALDKSVYRSRGQVHSRIALVAADLFRPQQFAVRMRH